VRRTITCALIAASLLATAGCGGDDDDGGGTASQSLKDAVAKTEAAKTARVKFDIAVEGAQSGRFTGDALVDFENDRDLLTMNVQGQTLQMFSDAGKEYVREGTSGRYQPFPASQASPVENNPADSLKYLGTDVIDVKESEEEGCLEGKLDFDRVVARADAQSTEELEEVRGLEAPVVVCVDGEGRIRSYDVELTVQDETVMMKSTLSDHGTAPPLEPLGPDERPR
jgi:hypothetical protein